MERACGAMPELHNRQRTGLSDKGYCGTKSEVTVNLFHRVLDHNERDNHMRIRCAADNLRAGHWEHCGS